MAQSTDQDWAVKEWKKLQSSIFLIRNWSVITKSVKSIMTDKYVMVAFSSLFYEIFMFEMVKRNENRNQKTSIWDKMIDRFLTFKWRFFDFVLVWISELVTMRCSLFLKFARFFSRGRRIVRFLLFFFFFILCYAIFF